MECEESKTFMMCFGFSHCVVAAGSEIMEEGVCHTGVSLKTPVPLVPSLSHLEVSVDSIYICENCMVF